MAKSNATKQKEYRDRKKIDRAWLTHYNELKRLRRQRKLNKYRKADRIQKKRKRQQNKEMKCVNTANNSFRSLASLNKALNRVKRHLPNSPSKKTCILVKLAELSSSSSKLDCKLKAESKLRLSAECVTAIKEFYNADDVSWQCPGRKDYVLNVSDAGSKDKIQKKYMIMSIGEAHQLFLEKYPMYTVGRSKFAALRPSNLKFRTDIPANVCTCPTHANLNDLLSAVHDKVAQFPDNHNALLNLLLCDRGSYECSSGQCEVCCLHNVELTLCMIVEDSGKADEFTHWYQWETSTDTAINDSQKKTIRKEMHEGSITEAVEQILEKFPLFRLHSYIKNEQSRYFHHKLKNLQDYEAVMQIDFSENGTVINQDAIQSSYWCQQQVGIYTVVVWLKNITLSYAVLTNYLSHDKYAVNYFNKLIINDLIVTRKLRINRLEVFSDGAAQHFKQRFTLHSFSTLTQVFPEVDFYWNYFASSHGKGAVDGIGGTLKRAVYDEIKSRRSVATNWKDYACIAKRIMKTINVFVVDDNNITADKETQNAIYAVVKHIYGIQKMHRFHVLKTGVIEGNITSFHNNHTLFYLTPESELQAQVQASSDIRSEELRADTCCNVTDTLLVDDCVEVKITNYDKTKQVMKFYFAKVTNINGDDFVELRYFSKLDRYNNLYKLTEDTSFERRNQIVRKVYPSVSSCTGSRVVYSIV